MNIVEEPSRLDGMDDGCGCDDVRPVSAHLGFARSDMSCRASPHATCRLPPKKQEFRPRACPTPAGRCAQPSRGHETTVCFCLFLPFSHVGGNSAHTLSTNRARRLHNLPAPVEFFDRRRLGRATRGPQTALSGFVRLARSRERLCRPSRALFYSAFPRRIGLGAFRPRAPRGSRESETRARRRERAHPLSPLTRTRARRLGTRRAEHGRARRRQGGAPGKQQSALERRERGRR